MRIYYDFAVVIHTNEVRRYDEYAAVKHSNERRIEECPELKHSNARATHARPIGFAHDFFAHEPSASILSCKQKSS